ncbi:DUF551 domain-containing protein [Klebsiella pneumoniae]|uniref:DUF551 domain-containing protein n=1 Tax=Klebsiella pneumoniae TaxID=573 RepID=UPI001F4DA30F|nr:DUF551 domain-containing protein [Klebsiella pneumoniae]MCH9452578.1 DUF551 domain-containing protein [Klebsiella pneumoniae]
MTSKLTRERIELIANFHRAMTLPPSHAEIEELARMALAAMDSEPVAYISKSDFNAGYPHILARRDFNKACTMAVYAAQPAPVVPMENHIGSKNSLDAIVSFIKSKSNPTVKCYEEVSEQLFKDNCHGIHSHVIEYILKLGEELEDLRAEQDEVQPAPVVNGEYGDAYQGAREDLAIWKCRALEAEESVRKLEKINDHLVKEAQGESRMGEPVIAQPVPVVPNEIKHRIGGLDWGWEGEFNRGWNACRAAMLAAAPQSPGSEPATVPGKWIPVIERMPPSRHEVLVGCWWGEKPRWCCKWAAYIPGHPDAQSSGWLIPGASWTPTHWMPLPNPPKE